MPTVLPITVPVPVTTGAKYLDTSYGYANLVNDRGHMVVLVDSIEHQSRCMKVPGGANVRFSLSTRRLMPLGVIERTSPKGRRAEYSGKAS